MKRHEGLLGCPFCGGEAHLTSCEVRPGDYVGRAYCACGAQVVAADLGLAIAAWNARTPSPSGAREIEAAAYEDEGMYESLAIWRELGDSPFEVAALNAIESALRSQGRGEGEVSAAEALDYLVISLNSLIEESEGVYGLHLNGDPSPWAELLSGGQFEEWLGDALAQANTVRDATISEGTPVLFPPPDVKEN